MMKKIKLAFIACLLANILLAQKSQSAYQEAKNLFEQGLYDRATSSFGDLIDDVDFGAYARFYQGLSFWKSDKKQQARAVWKKLLFDYPNWKNNTEVLYWLSVAAFEQGNPDEGLTYLDSYTQKFNNTDAARQLVQMYLIESGVTELSALQRLHPENRPLAALLYQKMMQQPVVLRNQEQVIDLQQTYQFDRTDFASDDLENVFRKSYSVSLVLPFLFEDISNPTSVIRNLLVMELYQGMLLAKEDLEKEGILLDYYLYDTRRNAETTRSLLPKLVSSDLIVGPFYPEPISIISEFSSRAKINMVNPLSNNAEYVNGNPHAFLMKPSYETMARSLARFATQSHQNPHAMIFYSRDPRDSTFAYNYYLEALANDAKIVAFQSLDELDAKAMLDALIKTYEHIYTKEEADSIAEIPGRFIKTRKIREEELDKKDPMPWFYEETDPEKPQGNKEPQKLLAYEMKLKIPKDSIGHIMIASRSNTIVNNMISAVATRGDSTGLYGYGDWFDFGVVNYKLMQSLGLTVANADYVDFNHPSYHRFEQLVNQRFNSPTTSNHVAGYECMYYLGKMMNKYGKYFQTGFIKEGITSGNLMMGFDFSSSNDNQIVPMVRLQDLKKIVVEKSVNEDRK